MLNPPEIKHGDRSWEHYSSLVTDYKARVFLNGLTSISLFCIACFQTFSPSRLDNLVSFSLTASVFYFVSSWKQLIEVKSLRELARSDEGLREAKNSLRSLISEPLMLADSLESKGR